MDGYGCFFFKSNNELPNNSVSVKEDLFVSRTKLEQNQKSLFRTKSKILEGKQIVS